MMNSNDKISKENKKCWHCDGKGYIEIEECTYSGKIPSDLGSQYSMENMWETVQKECRYCKGTGILKD